MPSMLEIPRDIAARLAALADAEGLALEDYLRRLLDEKSSRVERPNGKSRVERVRLFDEWIAGLEASTPALSDGQISRESIYGERG